MSISRGTLSCREFCTSSQRTFDKMPVNLLDLPRELQSVIFGFLPDLDDALCLSQTCHSLRCLYVTDKRLIDRRIIARAPISSALTVSLILLQISSHVYKYYLCLSKFVEANKDIAELFEQHPVDIPPKK